MLRTSRMGVICFAVALAFTAAGCKKKPAPVAPVTRDTTPPPPAPDTSIKPTILEFSVEPSTVERGQSALLKWNVSNANQISIDNGVGDVQANGTRRVIPSESTTYRLTATGPNGSVSATTTVNVTAPAPPSAPPTVTKQTFESAVSTMLSDAYFDYDSNVVRADARTTLTRDADALKKIFTDFPSGVIIIEGHCDERGSAEYNLGLGDQRATSAKNFLVELGVPGDRLRTVSYGKERPQCTEQTEDCYQRNRRAHFSTQQ